MENFIMKKYLMALITYSGFSILILNHAYASNSSVNYFQLNNMSHNIITSITAKVDHHADWGNNRPDHNLIFDGNLNSGEYFYTVEDVRNATDSAIFTITIKLNSDSTPLVFNVDMKEKTNSEPTLLRVNNNPNYYIVYFHYKTNETTISIIKKLIHVIG